MKHSESIKNLAADFHKAQQKVKRAFKGKENPFYKSTYADLEEVWNSCYEAFSSHNFSIIQGGNPHDGKDYLETILLHISAEWISGEMELRLTKNDSQAQASAVTYLRRIGLASICGVMTTDDDGNAAVEPPKGSLPPQLISDAQIKRLHTLAKIRGMTADAALNILVKHGFKTSTEITKDKYDSVCKDIESFQVIVK